MGIDTGKIEFSKQRIGDRERWGKSGVAGGERGN